MRAARAAGSIDATTATVSSTSAEATTGKNARHLYIREIAACHLRQDESECRACHDARRGHCGAFRDDIFEKKLRLPIQAPAGYRTPACAR